MKTALIVKADGHTEIAELSDGGKELQALQQTVGGLIEAVRLEPNVVMWVNEEGLIRGLPVNPLASFIHSQGREPITVITGDAIITGMDERGETKSLTSGQVDTLLGYVKSAINS